MSTFTVWCPERGEDSPVTGRWFIAADHCAAAEKWAERLARVDDELAIAIGLPATVFVRNDDTGEQREVVVSVKEIVVYRAEVVWGGS